MSSYWNPSRASLGRSSRWEAFSCTVSSRVHTTMNTCLHLQGSYECVGTELLALHWAASPATATIMFCYEIMGTQQHRDSVSYLAVCQRTLSRYAY